MSIQAGFFAYLHELTEAIHIEKIPQFLVGIHKHDLTARLSHMLEKAQNFTDPGAIYKWNVFEINNYFLYALIHDGIEATLEGRAILKCNLALDADDSTLFMRFDLDVHGRLGQNTVTFLRQEQAPDTCHAFTVCSPSAQSRPVPFRPENRPKRSFAFLVSFEGAALAK
jgi:hypothetical protein